MALSTTCTRRLIRTLALTGLVALPLLPGPSPAAAAADASRLSAGQVLGPGSTLRSPTGQYTLSMQPDGDLVELAGARPVWSSGSRGNPGARAVLQGDGDLVVRSATGRLLWHAASAGSGADVVVLSDSGSVILARGTGTAALWSSRTRLDVLRSGQQLAPGDALRAGNGRHRAVMQKDGEVGLYDRSAGLWGSGTRRPGASLVLQPDGDLVVRSSSGQRLFSSGTAGKHADKLIMQSDGNLVLYAGSKPVWSAKHRPFSPGYEAPVLSAPTASCHFTSATSAEVTVSVTATGGAFDDGWHYLTQHRPGDGSVVRWKTNLHAGWTVGYPPPATWTIPLLYEVRSPGDSVVHRPLDPSFTIHSSDCT